MAATYDLISGQTFTGTTNTCTFSSIPSSYTDLVIQGDFVETVGNVDMYMRFNSDSGNNYDYLGAGSQSTGFKNFVSYGASQIIPLGAVNSMNNTSTPNYFEVNIAEYSNTSYMKNGVTNYAYVINTSLANTGFQAFRWRNTNAITTITFTLTGSTSNIYGTINLYGITAADA